MQHKFDMLVAARDKGAAFLAVLGVPAPFLRQTHLWLFRWSAVA